MKSITKKSICLFLVVVLLFAALSACGSTENKKEKAKEVLNLLLNVSAAIDIFGDDIVSAFSFGIKNQKETSYTINDIAKDLSYFSKEELQFEMLYLIMGEKWQGKSLEEMQSEFNNFMSTSSYLLDTEVWVYAYGKSSYWVNVIELANVHTGRADKIQSTLDEAKSKLKELSEKNPDYNVCEKLKDLYLKIVAQQDFCNNPSGTLDEIKEKVSTFNQYVQNAKNELSFDLE